MATRTMPFCLEMLTFRPPRELLAHSGNSWTRGAPGALREFLDARSELRGHSGKAAGMQPEGSRRGEGLWPLAQCLFAWKCLHLGHPESSGTLGGFLDARRAPGALGRVLDARRAYGHSHNAFLLGNAYI